MSKSVFKDAVAPKRTAAAKGSVTASGSDSNLPLVVGVNLGKGKASGLAPKGK